jgi:hypothetical protein
MTKPLLLAKAFATYLDEEIERDALLMLMHTIDMSFILDLNTFIRTEGADVENEVLWRERLASSGLLLPFITGGLNDSEFQYGLAPLGTTFLHVIKYCEGLSPG